MPRPEIASALDFIFSRLSQRRFFTTESGYAGLGSDDIQQGGLVCVLYGCRLPVVLRNAAGKREAPKYEFHGPAYLEGIMMGETQLESVSHCGPVAETNFLYGVTCS